MAETIQQAAPDRDQIAADAWARVIAHALRLAAAEYPNESRATSKFRDALADAIAADGGTYGGIYAGWKEFRSRVDCYDSEARSITAGLVITADAGARFLAERGTIDPAARGRESQRRTGLLQHIDYLGEVRKRR